ncbi:GNAT family N-acetyltransferase [Mariniluteicoccus endophyticus]
MADEEREVVRIADARLDLLAHHSWPATDVRDIDGWLVRRTRGATRRANSVLPHGEPADLAMAIRLVEQLYRQRGLVPTFLITPAALPTTLDDELAERGYVADGACDVMVAQTEDVVRLAGERTRGVHVSGALDDAHLALWAAHGGRTDDALLGEMVEVATGTPAVFASMRRDGRVWAVGRGTLREGWCGLDGFVTDPAARGRGLATDLIAEIARRALAAGARGMWLQVADGNPARGLYERLSFTEQYRYHYRRKV